MKIRSILIALIIALALVFFMACEAPSFPSAQAEESGTTTSSALGQMSVITVGSHSYISIDFDGTPHKFAQEILEIVDSFEKQHPELEVTGWRIEKEQNAQAAWDRIYGVWIDHRLRQGS